MSEKRMSIRDRMKERKQRKIEAEKEAKLISKQELKAKLKQIENTITALRAHELLMENNVERQRRAAIAARANPAQKSRFIRELRKLEYYYVYLWRTQDLKDALENKQMEVEMAIHTREVQEDFVLADGLLQETLVDLDKMLGKGVVIGQSQNAAAIDRMFESYVKQRGNENPFSEEYIDRLLSGNATVEDIRSPQIQPVVVNPNAETAPVQAAPAAPAADEMDEDRLQFMENFLGMS